MLKLESNDVEGTVDVNLQTDTNDIANALIVNRVNKKIVSLDLQTDLSEEELRQIANNIVEIGMQMRSKEDRLELLKSESSQIKKSIDLMLKDMLTLAAEYDYGYRNRTYSCYRVDNYELKQYEYYDVVTQKLLKTESFEDGDMFALPDENDEVLGEDENDEVLGEDDVPEIDDEVYDELLTA